MADSFEDLQACQRATPILKYMARHMLLQETATAAQEGSLIPSDQQPAPLSLPAGPRSTKEDASPSA